MSTTMRTTIKVTLSNKNERNIEYLGLLGTGSNRSLIGEKLVTQHKLVTQKTKINGVIIMAIFLLTN